MKPNSEITVSPTPNPQSLKFTLNQKISEENWEADNINQAGRSPLAQKILGFPWAVKIFIGKDFITITKEDWAAWDIVTEPLGQLIKDHIQSGQVVLYPPAEESQGEGRSDSKVIQKIKALLDKDIQPAVAQDGGFIAFAGYKNGTVFLKMQGACSGCPSASLTLKQGVETHLKSRISEVKQVVAL